MVEDIRRRQRSGFYESMPEPVQGIIDVILNAGQGLEQHSRRIRDENDAAREIVENPEAGLRRNNRFSRDSTQDVPQEPIDPAELERLGATEEEYRIYTGLRDRDPQKVDLLELWSRRRAAAERRDADATEYNRRREFENDLITQRQAARNANPERDRFIESLPESYRTSAGALTDTQLGELAERIMQGRSNQGISYTARKGAPRLKILQDANYRRAGLKAGDTICIKV